MILTALWHVFWLTLFFDLPAAFWNVADSLSDLAFNTEYRDRVRKDRQDAPQERDVVMEVALMSAPLPVGSEKGERPHRVSVTDKDVETAMRAVKTSIDRRWRTAKPPGWGRVRVLMLIAPTGEIINIGVTHEAGSPELDKYVVDLVRECAPFTRAAEGLLSPIWIECEFTVKAQADEQLQ